MNYTLVAILAILYALITLFFGYRMGFKHGSSKTLSDLEKENRCLKAIQVRKEKPKIELFPLRQDGDICVFRTIFIKDPEMDLMAFNSTVDDLLRLSDDEELVVINNRNYYITQVICNVDIIQNQRTISIRIKPEFNTSL